MPGVPENSVWSSMKYEPPRGRCNFKNGIVSGTCSCMRFMLHPVKAATSFECDGCNHHASYHNLDNPEDDRVLARWAEQAKQIAPASQENGHGNKRRRIADGSSHNGRQTGESSSMAQIVEVSSDDETLLRHFNIELTPPRLSHGILDDTWDDDPAHWYFLTTAVAERRALLHVPRGWKDDGRLKEEMNKARARAITAPYLEAAISRLSRAENLRTKKLSDQVIGRALLYAGNQSAMVRHELKKCHAYDLNLRRYRPDFYEPIDERCHEVWTKYRKIGKVQKWLLADDFPLEEDTQSMVFDLRWDESQRDSAVDLPLTPSFALDRYEREDLGLT